MVGLGESTAVGSGTQPGAIYEPSCAEARETKKQVRVEAMEPAHPAEKQPLRVRVNISARWLLRTTR